jgi:hypothetical protein
MFVVVDELIRAGRGLDHLARVTEDRLVAAQRLLLRGIELRGGDLVELVLEEIETQRAVALRVADLTELIGRDFPLAKRARVSSTSASWPPYSSTSSR